MNGFRTTVLAILMSCAITSQTSAADGNPARGQRAFGVCAACHSLQPKKNMTGPSLADLWNRKAGSLESFSRYSAALKSANIVWNDRTLDEWIRDPQHLIPGNQMTFAGIKEPQARADLLAFLKEATKPGGANAAQQHAPTGGMMNMTRSGDVPRLKTPDPAQRVKAITYCKDTYTITTADGRTHKFWERNLRLKTDSSDDGPEKNAPALLPAGMMGDRADVIFADPAEISAAIGAQC